MLTTPEQYAASLAPLPRQWVQTFLDHMASVHPQIPPVMFRQCPMFKVGNSYVMFTAAQTHFTLHTLNFLMIEELKALLPRASYGKGCVKVPFACQEAIPVLKAFCDRVIALNLSENPPPVDMSPEIPRAEALQKIFPASKASWLPLYERLLVLGKARLPAFSECFLAAGVLWKNSATFAQISCTKTALRVEFFSDQLHEEYHPVKVLRLSANRVAHTVEVLSEAALGEVIEWVAVSCALKTKQ